jgi:hypothetical protein
LVMGVSTGMVASNPHAARSAEIALGLRAARALALVRRSRPDAVLADRDRLELEGVRDALARAASAVLREPSAVQLRGRRNIASVGLALSTAVRGTPTADRSAAAGMLRDLAADLDTVIQGRSLEVPQQLTSFLGALVDAANRSTARGGETLVTAES